MGQPMSGRVVRLAHVALLIGWEYHIVPPLKDSFSPSSQNLFYFFTIIFILPNLLIKCGSWRSLFFLMCFRGLNGFFLRSCAHDRNYVARSWRVFKSQKFHWILLTAGLSFSFDLGICCALCLQQNYFSYAPDLSDANRSWLWLFISELTVPPFSPACWTSFLVHLTEAMD